MDSPRVLKVLFLVTALTVVGWWCCVPGSRPGKTGQPLSHQTPSVAGVIPDGVSAESLQTTSVAEPGVREVAAGEEMGQSALSSGKYAW